MDSQVSFEHRKSLIVDLGFDPAQFQKLQDYLDLLWSSNEELNLISRKMTPGELIDNHLIDCLLPLSLFPDDARVIADFGSGGGLPAVVYAIQFPSKRFRLFEKSKLKQEFLRACARIAPNLSVNGEIPLDLEDVDLVTARAFKPLDVILDLSRRYYQKKGKYFLLKGRREKIDEELLLARKKFKDLQARIEPLKSPVLDVERHVVLI